MMGDLVLTEPPQTGAHDRGNEHAAQNRGVAMLGGVVEPNRDAHAAGSV